MYKISIKFGKNRISSIELIALFLALMPVFDPYVFLSVGSGFTLKIIDVVLLMLVAICFLGVNQQKKISWDISCYLFVLIAFFFVLTLISFSVTNYYPMRSFINALKNSTVEIVFVVFFVFIWQYMDRKRFIDIVLKVAFWSTILLFIQYVFVNLGVETFFDGKIPFLSIGKYEWWAPLVDPNTGDIRVHSIFQEPAYYAMYILPVFSYYLNIKEYKKAFFYFIALLISSSLVASLGACILFCVHILTPQEGMNINKMLRVIGILLFSIMVLQIMYNSVGFVKLTVDYVLERTGSIFTELNGERMSSSRYRLTGYIDYFETYPIFHKILGVGINQFSVCLNVDSYSNVMVSTILNYGILGGLGFVIFIVSLLKRMGKNNVLYLFTFLIVCCTDYQWVNGYFFYLLTWCMGIRENRENTRRV